MYMVEPTCFVLWLVTALFQGGVPANPYPPIEGSISPGAVHKVSGERWETTLTVKDEDPIRLPSHEPTAEDVLTQSSWFNCVKTFIHSKVALIRPPGSPEKVFVDEYEFHDDVGPVDATNDTNLILQQQVWIKGAPPQPPGGGS